MTCFVLCSSTVVKCNGRIYDWNEDGDMDITDSSIQVENLYARYNCPWSYSKYSGIFPVHFLQYTPLYSDSGKPVLFEDDIFKIEIPLTKNVENPHSKVE